MLFFLFLETEKFYACHWWVNYSSSHPVYELIISSLSRDDAYIGLLLIMAQQSLLLAVPVEISTNTLPSIKYSDNSSCLNSLALLVLFCFFLWLSLPPFPNEVSCWLHLFFIKPFFLFLFFFCFKNHRVRVGVEEAVEQNCVLLLFCWHSRCWFALTLVIFHFPLLCFSSTKRAHFCSLLMPSIHFG